MTEPGREAIQPALEKILASPAFQGSERMSRFLRFVVEHALRGDQAPLKEYLIGVNVFDRGRGSTRARTRSFGWRRGGCVPN